MTVRELITALEACANEYGDDIPVYTFDLDRDMCDIDEVEICTTCNKYGMTYYIYVGS